MKYFKTTMKLFHLKQGFTTQISWQAPKKIAHSRGLNLYVFTHLKGAFMKKTSKNLCLAGQI